MTSDEVWDRFLALVPAASQRVECHDKYGMLSKPVSEVCPSCGSNGVCGHITIPDSAMAPLRAVLFGVPGDKGEVCPSPICRGRRNKTDVPWSVWAHTTFEEWQKDCDGGCNGTGTIGARPVLSGLLVACSQPRTWVGPEMRCKECGSRRGDIGDDHGETEEPHNLVLEPHFKWLVENGEDEAACGMIYRRLALVNPSVKDAQIVDAWESFFSLDALLSTLESLATEHSN